MHCWEFASTPLPTCHTTFWFVKPRQQQSGAYIWNYQLLPFLSMGIQESKRMCSNLKDQLQSCFLSENHLDLNSILWLNHLPPPTLFWWIKHKIQSSWIDNPQATGRTVKTQNKMRHINRIKKTNPKSDNTLYWQIMWSNLNS